MEKFIKVYAILPSVLTGMVLSIFCLAPAQAQTAEQEFVEAKISYLGWDILTGIRIRPEDVRARANIEIKVDDPYTIAHLVRFLDLTAMKKAEGPGDPRLVIDLVKADGSITSFYASRFALYTDDSSKSREIDQRFRDVFDLFRTSQLSDIPQIEYSWEMNEWDWALPNLDPGMYDKNLVDFCIDDFNKNKLQDGWTVDLKSVHTSKDGRLWYFVLEGVNVKDTIVVYCYYVKDKKFISKFFIPMA